MLVVGVPAKVVRPVREQDLKYMRWLTEHYVALAQKYVKGEDVTVRPVGCEREEDRR